MATTEPEQPKGKDWPDMKLCDLSPKTSVRIMKLHTPHVKTHLLF